MSDTVSTGRPVPVPAGRLNRLARLGGFATQVAGAVAVNGAAEWARGRRPDLKSLLLTPANVQKLTNELAQMRGAAMKLGQLLSMDTGDVLPAELTDILSRLRSDAHYMPPKQLRQVLIANWGADWQRGFAHFDVRPIAAASIGQVHRARLRDGRTMAIKVQYPGVARSIDSDVANVGALLRASRVLPRNFDIAPYLDEAKRQLHEETDYVREGRHMAAFRDRLTNDAAFDVPAFHTDWSTRDILSMSFAAGRAIESVTDLDQATRDRVATDLWALLLKEMFVFGEVQSDPNFANYLFNDETGQIVLLDFGATRVLAPDLVARYRDLLAAGLSNDRTAMVETAEAIGFLSADLPDRHRARLIGMFDLAFDTLRAAWSHDFADTSLSDRMQADSMALVEDGFVPPPVPMDVLYLQRKIAGLVLLATRLRARVPLRPLLDPYLADSARLRQDSQNGSNAR